MKAGVDAVSPGRLSGGDALEGNSASCGEIPARRWASLWQAVLHSERDCWG